MLAPSWPNFGILRNVSGKPIASYRLGMTALNVNGHARHFPHDFSDTVQWPASGQRTAIWHTRLAHQLALPLAQAFLLEVTFADGTDWMDNGSHSCAVTSVQEWFELARPGPRPKPGAIYTRQ